MLELIQAIERSKNPKSLPRLNFLEKMANEEIHEIKKDTKANIRDLDAEEQIGIWNMILDKIEKVRIKLKTNEEQ